ncbi:predicted protein [Paecilomyces variotii No. 5]|uniref:Uncharacterized protein n=1 Tax=Byssochlamys spectabilis (strain No. 5 / NBRC 109023) TaxID=1356009 RepID=V5G9Y5_BYSSN|nr:predicted protein [Paecilomyces variotii No. 5]
MSTPTTPLGPKTDSLSGSPRKRRTLVDGDKLDEIIRELDRADDLDDPTLRLAVQNLKAVLSEADLLTQQLTPSKKARLGVEIVQASSLKSIDDAVKIFGLDYEDDDPYIWKVPEGPDVHLSPEAESLLTRMRRAKFWNRGSAEALSRTLIDILLFDRVEAHQDKLAARQLSVRGEVPLEATVSATRDVIVKGNADYALGYDPALPLDAKGFESISIVVEAKRDIVEKGGSPIAQTLAYMIGARQKRMNLTNPKRIVLTTYGMVTDGTIWRFLRLDGTRLLVSTPLILSELQGRSSIYKFVDAIVRSAISLSPHTTPQRQFPATQERWLEDIEPPIFGRPVVSSQQVSDVPEKDVFTSTDDYDNDELKDIEESEV